MKRLTEKQVIKLYVDDAKSWNPPATDKDIKGQIELAKLSYGENEGSQ